MSDLAGATGSRYPDAAEGYPKAAEILVGAQLALAQIALSENCKNDRSTPAAAPAPPYRWYAG